MTVVEDRPNRAFARDLGIGLVAGLLVGGMVAGVVVAQDFPLWGEVVWSFTLAGLIGLPTALLVRGAIHASQEIAFRHVPQDERPTTSTYALQTTRTLNIVAAMDVGAFLALLLAFAVGDGTLVPSP